jgi:hypothetical protein
MQKRLGDRKANLRAFYRVRRNFGPPQLRVWTLETGDSPHDMDIFP